MEPTKEWLALYEKVKEKTKSLISILRKKKLPEWLWML